MLCHTQSEKLLSIRNSLIVGDEIFQEISLNT